MRITRNGIDGARLPAWSDWLRSSLWAVPLAQVIAAVGLAGLTLWIDHTYGQELAWGTPFEVGPEGIRTTVATIAGSILTVAGVAFSITVVVLQLASSQYSPRIIRTFRRDRVIQVVLGLYTSTFVYAVLVLRTIRAGADGSDFVAPLSVTVAMALAVACMVALIVLVHHIAHHVQASTVVREIATETREAIESLLPEPLGPDADAPEVPPPELPGAPQLVRAWRDGYIEFIDTAAFERLAGARLACVVPKVGDFVRQGECLARVWIEDPGNERELDAGSVFFIASARTIRQDVRYGLHLIVDVALRALSPGINDPTTAIACVDVLGGLVCEIARRKIPSPMRRASDAHVQVYAPRPTRAELLAVAFEEIVSAADRSLPVLRAVAQALRAIEEAAGTGASFEGAIEEMRARILHVARTSSSFPPDVDRIARGLGIVKPSFTALPRART